MPAKKNTLVAQMQDEIAELKIQLFEAREAIEAIRTGQIDAFILEGESGKELYTLKTADHAYRIIVEKMGQGAVTLDADGLIHYCNSQFASMIEESLTTIIGMKFENFVKEDQKQSFSNLFQQAWEQNETGECILQAKSRTVPVQLSMTSIDMSGINALSIIVTDLSNQKIHQQLLEDNNRALEQANHSLELSNHDLQQFASVASHDLQEPLRKIQMFSTLIKSSGENIAAENLKYLDKILDSAARMKALIIDVLQYSKLSAKDAGFEPTNLLALVNEALLDFELIIAEKKAVISLSNLPDIEANPGQMRQLFHNIISNALKFSRDELAPVLEISATIVADKSFDSPPVAEGQFCILRFRDNGIGFDSKYQSLIFSLFERLHSKDRFEGTGIGLAIAKKITEKHNGLITTRSHEGSGAEFLILLPMTQVKN